MQVSASQMARAIKSLIEGLNDEKITKNELREKFAEELTGDKDAVSVIEGIKIYEPRDDKGFYPMMIIEIHEGEDVRLDMFNE